MKKELGLILIIKIREWLKQDTGYTKAQAVEDLELAIDLIKAED